MKDEKELKPASMRVRDAAESLLTIILEQVRIIYLFFKRVFKSTINYRLGIFHLFVVQKVCPVYWMK